MVIGVNSQAVNAGAGAASATSVGRPVLPAVDWRPVVVLGGIDMSAWVTGAVSVDLEEGAAGLADLSLCIPVGTPPPLGSEYSELQVGISIGDVYSPLWAGFVAGRPRWDPVTRTVQISGTDNLQGTIDAMPVAEIDALTPDSHWTVDLYSQAAGRSGWDYLQERLESCQGSVDISGGEPVYSPWHGVGADLLCGADSFVDGSLKPEFVGAADITNRVVITLSWRSVSNWQSSDTYSWYHPGTGGATGGAGFIQYMQSGETSELPDKDMVVSAIEGAGLTITGGGYWLLPESGIYHPGGGGDPIIWINRYYGRLLLGFGVTAAQRWQQAVTETYTLTVETAAAELSPVIATDSASVDDTADDLWSSSLSGAPSGVIAGDVHDDARRDACLFALLAEAETTLAAAARQHRISWSVCTAAAVGITRGSRAAVDGLGVTAAGKISRLQHELDCSAGTCLTTIEIAVCEASVGDAAMPALPARPAAVADTVLSHAHQLPTQLGGRGEAYDDNRLGFSGNYDGAPGDYPRRITVESTEIDADLTDERTGVQSWAWVVDLPGDSWEIV